MAQTADEIQSEMMTEMVNYPALTPLNDTSGTNGSNIPIWKSWMFVTATIISFFEQVMDLFKVDIQNIINNNQYGSDEWWYNQMLAFQFGDLLVFINNIFQYPLIDASRQVIKFCSINSSPDGVVQIKVAQQDGNNQPAVLTPDQLNGVYSYCKAIRPAGIRFTVLSAPADLLQLNGNIYYDAAGDKAVIQIAVEKAINDFLGTNNVNNFDGTLYVNKLIDAIQVVPGLVGNQVDITTIAARSTVSDYTTFTSSYPPLSGYIMIDPELALANTLTYYPIPPIPTETPAP
jgi:hypothetical protein